MAGGRLLARLRGGDRGKGGKGAPPAPRNRLDALWEEIELLERVRPPLSTAVLQRRPGEAKRARAELEPLERWERISPSSFSTYVADSNHVRLHRLLRFVRDGDRVFDVGIGYGYVTAMLHRERRIERYWGIDLRQQYADAALDAMQANGLDPSGVELEVKSLLDVDEQWMAGRRPDVALVLEVLEHIPDPAAALRVLGTTLPRDALVLFTVPILGRLDGVWGHVSRFDRGRIEQVCAEAGLTIHYVEPVFATWVLVAASRGAEAPARLAPLLAEAPKPRPGLRRAAGALPAPAPGAYDVRRVYIGGSRDYRRPQHDPEHVRVRANLTGVFCEVTAPASGSALGGIRLPMLHPELIRLELSCEGAQHVEEILVYGLDADERPRLAWSYEPGTLHPFDGRKTTWVLYPGRPTTRFRPSPDATDPAGVQAVDLVLRVRARGSVHLRLHRAAYSGPEAPDAAGVSPGPA